jgi:uncharacterized protein (TIGR02284 family)
MAEQNETLKVVNDLIATCRDSEEGFGKAAKGAQSDGLREKLTAISRKHADFADELARLVGQMGAQPAATPHWGGILHAGWVDLETRIRPKDDKTFVAECERGEQATVDHYRGALSRELPAEVRQVIERQFREVEDIVHDLKRMEQMSQKQL